MSNCPGKIPATNVNRVAKGKKYCMWLDFDGSQGIAVEIIGWRLSSDPTQPVEAPPQLKGMDPNYILLVKEISTGTTLTITDTHDNGGAMYYKTKRATFHEI